jgi:D-alanyl-lipoteichoic acid acyltransferase DltB (MBOAT superfamily)
MQIISPQFLLFAAVTLAVYYLLARKAQNIWLLLASYFFYVTISPPYAFVLLIVTLVNYFIGRKVSSRGWLMLGIGLDLSSFLALKLIAGPYGPRVVGLAGQTVAPDALRLLLPIGFSFYILQAISYLLDIQRGQAQPADNFVDFALYLTYFPKLLSGPIERPARFLSDLGADRRVTNVDFARSIGLILVGIIRKVIIADRINALLPPTVFSDPASFSSLEKLVWLLVFTFGLYNDFQGYTTIVRGLSGLFGINLSVNFRQPFFSRSFSDFWTRWHISLSFWLRDYIFFPTRRWLIQHHWPQWIATLLPPLLTMLASGYWHGAYATMLAWGLLHGLYLVSEQFTKFPRSHDANKFRATLGTLLVFSLTTLTWIPFASSSLRAAFEFITGLFAFTGGVSAPLPLLDLIPAAALALWLDSQEFKHDSDTFFLKWTPAAQAWGLALALWLLILYLGPQAGLVTFVYQGF